MTKAELRTVVKQAMGNRTSTTITDAWYDDRVMNGYRRLVTFQGMVDAPSLRDPVKRILRFKELEDRLTRTLDNTLTDNFVANQSGVWYVTDVYNRTGGTGLNYRSEKLMRQQDADDTGVPIQWQPGVENGVRGYYIWPRPATADDAISVYEYVVYEPALATDSTEPVIGEEWHMCIAYAACAEAANLIDNPEDEGRFEQKFMKHIAERTMFQELASQGGRAGGRRYIRVGGY